MESMAARTCFCFVDFAGHRLVVFSYSQRIWPDTDDGDGRPRGDSLAEEIHCQSTIKHNLQRIHVRIFFSGKFPEPHAGLIRLSHFSRPDERAVSLNFQRYFPGDS